jgi:predicted GNAT family N-acyltransferase
VIDHAPLVHLETDENARRYGPGILVHEYSLQVTSWQDDERSIRAVRQAVFIEEQGIAADDEWDVADENSSHVLVLSKKRDAVGTGRLGPNGKIARVAVIAECRGQGVGSAILKRLIHEAMDRGQNRVYLHAQTQALNFYKKMGFISDERAFLEAGIPHVLASLDF